MRKPVPTLKTVAKQARVAPSTVSRVLSGQTVVKISPETAKRVLAAARRLKFQPNAAAKSLKLRRTLNLALFVPEVSDPTISPVICGARDAAAGAGYSLSFIQFDEHTLQRKLHLQLLKEGRVDGLILAAAVDTVVKELLAEDLPFVLVNRHVAFDNKYVIVDDVAAAMLAVDHLVARGHRDIACLSGRPSIDPALRRFQGYCKSMEMHNLNYQSELVVECDWQIWDDGKRAMECLLNKGLRPSAVFASNLVVAIGAMTAIKRAGLRIPEDISLISIHDIPLAELLDPPLTVVKLPFYEAAHKATAALIEGLEHNTPIVPAILPPIGLIIRSSTAELRKQ